MPSSMRSPRSRLVGAVLASVVVTCAAPAVAAPAVAAPAVASAAAAWVAQAVCSTLPQAGSASPGIPWPQLRYDLTAISRISDGAGVTVAVLDSGVDSTIPQLVGAVRGGGDLVGSGNGLDDCVGHGTAVASIIAARPRTDSTLQGLAPSATILSIRVGERVQTDQGSTGAGTVQALVDGIRRAITASPRPQVLNLSISADHDDPALRAAIRDALAADIVVVAAAGNGRTSSRIDQDDPPLYPAAYDGVVGVGAISDGGLRWAQSRVGSYVDIMAPGDDVVGAAPGSGQVHVTGTSFAAPFVAATAALIRARFPQLRQDEVVRRLLATADPSAGSQPSRDYGYGVVNPLRALTEIVPPEPAVVDQAPAVAVSPRGPAAANERAPSGRNLVALGVLLIATLCLVVVAIAAPMGKARGWRPGTAGTTPTGPGNQAASRPR